MKSAWCDTGLTDQCLLDLSFNVNNNRCVNLNRTVKDRAPDKTKIDFDLVKNKLKNVRWKGCYNTDNVNLS